MISVIHEVDGHVVEFLEDLVKDAKAGTLRGVVVYGFRSKREYSVTWAGTQTVEERIGALFRTATEMEISGRDV